MDQSVTFPIEKVQQLRQRAARACQVSRKGPQGWSRSDGDPVRLLTAFPALRLNEGLVLRAYQFREGGNGNGIVWAMPEGLPFPEADECPRLRDRFLAPPRPAGSLDDIMEGIEGDGSPWSYLCASLFAREVAEFGAMWHGISWGTHRILAQDPLAPPQSAGRKTSFDGPSRNADEWQWLEPKPTEWEPEVGVAGSTVTVTFYTYSGLGSQVVYRHGDTYTRGRYQFESDRNVIAEGPGGFVF